MLPLCLSLHPSVRFLTRCYSIVWFTKYSNATEYRLIENRQNDSLDIGHRDRAWKKLRGSAKIRGDTEVWPDRQDRATWQKLKNGREAGEDRQAQPETEEWSVRWDSRIEGWTPRETLMDDRQKLKGSQILDLHQSKLWLSRVRITA